MKITKLFIALVFSASGLLGVTPEEVGKAVAKVSTPKTSPCNAKTTWENLMNCMAAVQAELKLNAPDNKTLDMIETGIATKFKEYDLKPNPDLKDLYAKARNGGIDGKDNKLVRADIARVLMIEDKGHNTLDNPGHKNSSDNKQTVNQIIDNLVDPLLKQIPQKSKAKALWFGNRCQRKFGYDPVK